MTAQFIVEDGSVVTGANALVSVADADQIMENYSSSADWSGVDGTEEEKRLAKENAIREATRYLNFYYIWTGSKSTITQSCQWPRLYTYDEDGWLINNYVVPDRVKEACAYLALQVIAGDVLLQDFDNESKVKKTKDVVGPITEEREYTIGESPDKTYQIADRLVAPFTIGDGETFYATNLERS